MTETTRGRIAYEEWADRRFKYHEIRCPWDQLHDAERADWEATATAAIEGSPELRDARKQCDRNATAANHMRAQLEEIRRLCQDPHGMAPGQVWGGKPRVAGDPLADIILDIIGQDPKPVPELDEAQSVESLITELGKRHLQINKLSDELSNLHTLTAEILSQFDASKGDGYRARVGQVIYRRWCERAGLTP